MKRICILSIPRSGTTHLCKLMESFGGVRAYHDLFHNNSSWKLNKRELTAISSVSGVVYKSIKDPALIQFAHDSPLRYLEILERTNASWATCLSFKIFPGQLEIDALRSDVLSHKDTLFLIVRRPLLDVFISTRKAAQTGKYKGMNTSDVSVILSASEYARWIGRVEDWFSLCRSALEKKGRAFVTLSYEKDIAIDARSVLEKLGAAFLENGIPVGDIVNAPVGVQKQDRSSGYAEKVSNWDEFVGDLDSLGIMPRSG